MLNQNENRSNNLLRKHGVGGDIYRVNNDIQEMKQNCSSERKGSPLWIEKILEYFSYQ